MTYGGIDGCRYGWVLMKSDGNQLSFGGLYSNIEELLNANTNLDRVLIDAPIGLSSKGRLRTVDQQLRQMVKPRTSTVFNMPCREAVYAKDFKTARQQNIEVEGKSLSEQTLNIIPKIREIDEFLNQNKSSKNPFIEGHPEFSFKALNPEKEVLLTKKSTKEGIEERLKILEKYQTDFRKLYDKILAQTLRKNLKRDDILDASALCLANQMAGKDLQFLWNKPKTDERGIEMKIGYFKND